MTDLQKTHDKQNEDYIFEKTKIFSAGQNPGELEALASGRLDKLFAVIDGVDTTTENYVESLDIFVSFFDDVVLECAELAGRRQETEEKIIALCEKILPDKKDRDTKNEHVTARIIDCTKSREKPEAIAKELTEAILDGTNPLRLGSFIFAYFCAKNPGIIASEVMDYLMTEREVRAHLIKGDDTGAFVALETLLKSPIDTPERYLLVSLNSFYHGFEADAHHALDIGLKKHPGNERLLSAKGALQ